MGIHFYQTHPDFIRESLGNKKVRFIQQPEGTYHPKLYLFHDNHSSWELIIGSANFTNEAFARNTEASMLISSKENGSNDLYKNALHIIHEGWEIGKVFDSKDLESYSISWRNHRQKITSLSGRYGGENKQPIAIHEVPMAVRTWDEFITEVRRTTKNRLKNRLRVIEIAQNLFKSVEHFNELTEDQRKFVAGIPNQLQIKGAEGWPDFGSMMGAGIYKNRINENDQNISVALDQIPLFGQITKRHYDEFINYYRETFSGNYLATATRLLCMKRPDIFVCFDSKNRSKLCHDFKIKQSGMNYERYWQDVVLRIYDSEWWQNPAPKNAEEKKVSDARAAFLDVLYYES